MEAQIYWRTIVGYIDEETGEILKEYQIKNGEYLKHKKETSYARNKEIGGHRYNIRTIEWLCRPNPQTALFRTNGST